MSEQTAVIIALATHQLGVRAAHGEFEEPVRVLRADLCVALLAEVEFVARACAQVVRRLAAVACVRCGIPG